MNKLDNQNYTKNDSNAVREQIKFAEAEAEDIMQKLSRGDRESLDVENAHILAYLLDQKVNEKRRKLHNLHKNSPNRNRHQRFAKKRKMEKLSRRRNRG